MGSGLRTGWLILGILLLLIVLSEVGLRLALTARDWLLDRPLTEDAGAELTIKKWLRTGADAHQGAEWVRDHYRELILSKGIVPSVQPFIWRPYVYRRRPPFQGRTIQVDRDGLRATWNPPPREGIATGDTRHPPRKAAVDDPPPVRLFTFGASTMWGWGARDDYTVASHLSKLLHARGYRVQVTNYGQPSYVGTQETIALLRAIHQGGRPDIVLFYDGYSDVMIAASGSDEVGIPHMEDARHGEFGLLDRPRRLREYAVRQLPVEYLWGIGRLAAKLRSGFRPP
ncbi:MAG: hypothetical protein LGR52_09705, partial [Candidatus Thiosymbion ectosymbiont of Robbea hypermnestra]|nr:hypothetical protein [Candidatus Thiosymbion ectosymbiont of Robbea hypermnestra]